MLTHVTCIGNQLQVTNNAEQVMQLTNISECRAVDTFYEISFQSRAWTENWTQCLTYLLDADPQEPRRLYATESSSSSADLITSTSA